MKGYILQQEAVSYQLSVISYQSSVFSPQFSLGFGRQSTTSKVGAVREPPLHADD